MEEGSEVQTYPCKAPNNEKMVNFLATVNTYAYIHWTTQLLVFRLIYYT